jgi:hypothetical protein
MLLVISRSVSAGPSERTVHPRIPLCEREEKEKPVSNSVSYRTVQVDGLSIFYREAGPKDAPALLLLHGLPSSSRMYAIINHLACGPTE